LIYKKKSSFSFFKIPKCVQRLVDNDPLGTVDGKQTEDGATRSALVDKGRPAKDGLERLDLFYALKKKL